MYASQAEKTKQLATLRTRAGHKLQVRVRARVNQAASNAADTGRAQAPDDPDGRWPSRACADYSYLLCTTSYVMRLLPTSYRLLARLCLCPYASAHRLDVLLSLRPDGSRPV